jgi:membrane fusion protein, multidrug efflux system
MHHNPVPVVEKRSADSDELARIDAGPRAEEGVAVEHAAKSLQRDPASTLVRPADHRPRWKRTLPMGALAALVLAAIWVFGVPWIQLTINAASSDDAYLNGHVTFVAARGSGQIAGVLVDEQPYSQGRYSRLVG